jgi:hypothetical protein
MEVGGIGGDDIEHGGGEGVSPDIYPSDGSDLPSSGTLELFIG